MLVQHGAGADMWNLRLSSFLPQIRASTSIGSATMVNNIGLGYQQSRHFILGDRHIYQVSYTSSVLQNLCAASQGKSDALVDDNPYHGGDRDFLHYYYMFSHLGLQPQRKALESIFTRVLLQFRNDVPGHRCIQHRFRLCCAHNSDLACLGFTAASK